MEANSPSIRAIPARPSEAAAAKLDARRFAAVRAATERLSEPLSAEDCVTQSMADASPVKWHLAHTSWFFETFVLADQARGYRLFHPRYGYLFNSYYEAVGERVARPGRGLLTRPSLAEVRAYRRHVDQRMVELLDSGQLDEVALARVELGLQHEQQHQELILTDVKHLLWLNPLRPAYREPQRAPARSASDRSAPLGLVRHPGGLVPIGHADLGFAFDNESPRHAVHLETFELASRPATAGEYLAFIEDGGYERPELWLSDGWDSVQRDAWRAPLYWERDDGRWSLFTLDGPRELDPAEPVCHVSYYEADAFARWSGARLAHEGEWEAVAAGRPVEGNFADSGALHPRPAAAPGEGPHALFGDVWEWTQSAYAAYPGYQPLRGALGEYNGKFMCNQLVLRGGSCASPRGHLRASYRNFFRPEARWQFSGIRLARDA